MENLYEGRDGIAKLASALMKILSEIEAAKKKNLGHIPEDLSGPNHVKYAAVEALAECVRRGIVPPWRLVVLVRRLMGVSNERKRRGHTKVPLSRLLSIQREKQLSGRVLGREARARGLKISDTAVRRRLRRDEEHLRRHEELFRRACEELTHQMAAPPK